MLFSNILDKKNVQFALSRVPSWYRNALVCTNMVTFSQKILQIRQKRRLRSDNAFYA